MTSYHLAATVRRSSSRSRLALVLLTLPFILILTLYHSTSSPHDHPDVRLFRRQEPANSSVSISPTVTLPRGPLLTGSSSSAVSQTTSSSSSSSSSSTSTPPTTTVTSTSTSTEQPPTTTSTSTTTESTTSSSTSTESTSSPTTTSTPRTTQSLTPSPSFGNADPTPATTLIFNGNPLSPNTTPTDQSTPDQTSSAPTGSLASQNSSFWKNKGGVAGTFVVVSLFVVAGLGIAFMTWWKKRRARQHARLEDEMYTGFKDRDTYQASSPSLVSPGGDPFRSVHRTPSPPGSSEGHVTRFNISPPIHLSQYYNQQQQYLPPSQLQAQAQAQSQAQTIHLSVPSPIRKNGAFRKSDDSFYGGAARPGTQY